MDWFHILSAHFVPFFECFEHARPLASTWVAAAPIAPLLLMKKVSK